VLENRRNIRSDEKLAVAQTDDNRRAFANGDNRVGSSVVIIESAKIPRSSLTVYAPPFRAKDFRVLYKTRSNAR
jgi:hypothetical protein